MRLFIKRFAETVESSICKGKTPIDPLIPKLNKLKLRIITMILEAMDISSGNVIIALYMFLTTLTITN